MRGRAWTEEEITYLEKNYTKLGADEVAEKLKRTSLAVQNCARRHGITSMWSQEDIEFVRDHYGKMSTKTIAKRLNRSEHSIRQRAFDSNISSKDHGLLNSRDAAALIGKDSSTIRYWADKGIINARRKNRKCLIAEKDLVAFLRKYPEKWDATQCEEWYFRKYDWFKQKRKEDFQKLVKERWGEDAC